MSETEGVAAGLTNQLPLPPLILLPCHHRFVDTYFAAAKRIAEFLTVREKLAFLHTHK